MIKTHARNVVLGAGAMGLATAYQLARRGEPVLLVEQFGIGHDRGSSHGDARITRHSYADLKYARLMPAAFAAWRELEADAGESFYIRTGGLSLGSSGSDYVRQVAESLNAIGCPHRLMKGRDLNATSTLFRVDDDLDIVFEPDAGLLLARHALEAMLRLARSIGRGNVVVRDKTPVLRLDLESSRPTLVLNDETITADHLIIAAGPWIGRLIPHLGSRMIPERQQVLYFQPPDRTSFAVGRMPVFISIGQQATAKYYGMPDLFGGGVKVARHGGEAVDPDDDHREIAAASIDEIRYFLKQTLPGLAPSPLCRQEICKYTVAPDENFHIEFYKNRFDVIIASPCSGHGFKFSALIGKSLADLATTGATDKPLLSPAV